MRALPAPRRASASVVARWIPALLLTLVLGSARASAEPPSGPPPAASAFPAPGAWVPSAEGEGSDLVYLICEASGRARYGLTTRIALVSISAFGRSSLPKPVRRGVAALRQSSKRLSDCR